MIKRYGASVSPCNTPATMSKYSVSPSGDRSIGLHVNAHKTEYMCYNQSGDISTLKGTPLKLVDKFTYLGSSVESTEKDIETRLMKAWTAINRLSTIWKSDLTDKMKRSFFQAAVTSILLYGCTTWTLTKRLEKKLDGNYTRMLRAILNKSWQQRPTRHQLYGHLPPITKTIQVRRTRHAGHCWRSRDELIRDVLLWIPTHGRAKAGRPARTYIQQLCEDTGCCPEDLPRAMNDREEWRERVRDIRAASTIWWWWYKSISSFVEFFPDLKGRLVCHNLRDIFFYSLPNNHWLKIFLLTCTEKKKLNLKKWRKPILKYNENVTFFLNQFLNPCRRKSRRNFKNLNLYNFSFVFSFFFFFLFSFFPLNESSLVGFHE